MAGIKGISADKLARLAEVKNKPKPRRGGRRKAGGVDTSVRDMETWFKLRTQYYDDEGEKAQCSNDECLDPRPPEKGKLVAQVNGVFMCRYCFLDGYHNVDPDQPTLEDEAA